MSLDRMSTQLSAKQISTMVTNDKFDFNHIVQRGLVWEPARKTYLINSMILKYPVSQIWSRRDRDTDAPRKKGSSRYVIMDGKQRLTTIASFIKGEWKLSDMQPITYTTYNEEVETIDISGKYFEELPEEIQDIIKDTSITVVCFDDITPEEERELFKRLNNGKPLSTKARVLANCKDLENILNFGDHDLFHHMMTENAFSQKNHVSIIMKFWAMLNKPINEVSFEGKIFNPMVEDTIISEEEKIQLIDNFDYIEEVRDAILSEDSKESKKLAKKFYTETHLVSMVPYLNQAREDDTSADMFAQFVADFFNNTPEDEMSKYTNATKAGSAKTDNIKIRDEVIRTAYDAFFQIA